MASNVGHVCSVIFLFNFHLSVYHSEITLSVETIKQKEAHALRKPLCKTC